MKQLLYTCEKLVIAGLNDRAFAVHESAACELLPPEIAAENKTEHAKEQNAASKHASQKKECPNTNEIQAVALSSFDGQVWCAVSRYNKTLSLYCMERSDAPLPETIQPTTVHQTVKRVLCLTFATVPYENGSPLRTVIAGDLIGDATAYSLTDSLIKSKVLLGHTASMLSGLVQVTSVDHKQHVLSCDRDEKIRVTSFPQTFLVEGYLLGHTSFITCLDASAETCVSCGGDGTVRLWNYTENKEIAKYETTEQLPTRVAISSNGMHVAIIYDASHKLDILFTSSGTSLKLLQRIECPSQPLSINFMSDEGILVLTREPEYMMKYKLEHGQFVVHFCSPAVQALQKVADANSIKMPTTLMEMDESSGRLKMQKQDESRGVKGGELPWNKVERIQTAKDARMRREKRRRQKQEETE